MGGEGALGREGGGQGEVPDTSRLEVEDAPLKVRWRWASSPQATAARKVCRSPSVTAKSEAVVANRGRGAAPTPAILAGVGGDSGTISWADDRAGSGCLKCDDSFHVCCPCHSVHRCLGAGRGSGTGCT